jgi:hypothetical protein
MLTHLSKFLIFSALLSAFLAATTPAEARIRSADAIGQCLDAQDGAKDGGKVIAWPCHYQQPNNQGFVLDWLSPEQSKALWPNPSVPVRQMALVRVGEFCVDRFNRDDRNTMRLTRNCDKTTNNGTLWAPVNVGGNRFSMRDAHDQCLVLWGGVVEATSATFSRKPQEVRYMQCVDQKNTNALNAFDHLWQFWYVEQ